MRKLGSILDTRFGCWLLLLLAAWPFPALGGTNEVDYDAVPAIVEIRGRVVCLAEEMHRRHEAALPTEHPHLYGFKTQDGKYYTLLRTKFSEALFADARFREKELLLKGRIFPKSQIFETMTIRSLRNGVVHD